MSDPHLGEVFANLGQVGAMSVDVPRSRPAPTKLKATSPKTYGHNTECKRKLRGRPPRTPTSPRPTTG